MRVEVEYFIALTNALPELSGFSKAQEATLRLLYTNFSESDAAEIKEIEKTTNHDVKAVEYFLKNNVMREKISKAGFSRTKRDHNYTNRLNKIFSIIYSHK